MLNNRLFQNLSYVNLDQDLGFNFFQMCYLSKPVLKDVNMGLRDICCFTIVTATKIINDKSVAGRRRTIIPQRDSSRIFLSIFITDIIIYYCLLLYVKMA
jgi:hypothetical protein